MAWGDDDPVASAPAATWGASDAVAAPDKYKQAALEQQKKLKAAGVDTNEGFMGRITRGATMGAAGDITSALAAPLEMIKHGTMNPVEGYKYAKAIDEAQKQEGEDKTGALGSVAEGVAGLGSGLGMAKAGLTYMKPGMSLAQTIGAGLKEGAAYGGATGFFNGGDNLSDKVEGAGKGIAMGAALGGAAPLAISGASTLAAPVISNISARVNPTGFAQSKFAEALANSGKTASQIDAELSSAAGAGQGEFRAADAMGNAGQRALSTVTRTPGPGRQPAVDFLESRQAGQGRRLANALSEGFDAPQTAAQTTNAMKAARSSDAATNYGAARNAAGAVDVSPAIDAANQVVQPGVNPLLSPGTGIADNSIAGAVQRAKSFLTDGKSQLSDFNQAHLAKQELDAMIEGASPTVQRNLIPIRNALDDALASSSKPYAAARDTFRQQSQAINAVDTGKAAAMRGRTEDTIPAFGKLAPDAQQGFRVGYADPLIESVQGGAAGSNKARPFTSLAAQTEIPAFAAPGRGQPLLDKIGRENTMFETRRQAIGGSQTADNLADQAASTALPSVIGHALMGNYVSAAKQAVHGVANAAQGLTPNVRAELGRLLLSGNGVAQPAIQSALSKQAKAQLIANMLKSGGLAGGNEVLADRLRAR